MVYLKKDSTPPAGMCHKKTALFELGNIIVVFLGRCLFGLNEFLHTPETFGLF